MTRMSSMQLKQLRGEEFLLHGLCNQISGHLFCRGIFTSVSAIGAARKLAAYLKKGRSVCPQGNVKVLYTGISFFRPKTNRWDLKLGVYRKFRMACRSLFWGVTSWRSKSGDNGCKSQTRDVFRGGSGLWLTSVVGVAKLFGDRGRLVGYRGR